jgi:hypothetical protein
MCDFGGLQVGRDFSPAVYFSHTAMSVLHAQVAAESGGFWRPEPDIYSALKNATRSAFSFSSSSIPKR